MILMMITMLNTQTYNFFLQNENQTEVQKWASTWIRKEVFIKEISDLITNRIQAFFSPVTIHLVLCLIFIYVHPSISIFNWMPSEWKRIKQMNWVRRNGNHRRNETNTIECARNVGVKWMKEGEVESTFDTQQNPLSPVLYI